MQDQWGNVFPTFPIALPSEFDENSLSVAVTAKDGIACPEGFICNKTHQAECAEIQNVAVNKFKYGDIHGGAWCPLGSPYYLNCPIGFYCPDPVSYTSPPASSLSNHPVSNLLTLLNCLCVIALSFIQRSLIHPIRQRKQKPFVPQACFALTRQRFPASFANAAPRVPWNCGEERLALPSFASLPLPFSATWPPYSFALALPRFKKSWKKCPTKS